METESWNENWNRKWITKVVQWKSSGKIVSKCKRKEGRASNLVVRAVPYRHVAAGGSAQFSAIFIAAIWNKINGSGLNGLWFVSLDMVSNWFLLNGYFPELVVMVWFWFDGLFQKTNQLNQSTDGSLNGYRNSDFGSEKSISLFI